MKAYLNKILKGQPLNYEALLKALPADMARNHRKLFATDKVAPNRWRVSVLDRELFAELVARVEAPQNRAHAARQGDSHRHGTGHAFLLVFHEPNVTGRPEVVICSDEGANAGFRPAEQVLVVENEENFFHYQQMLEFAGQCLGTTLVLPDCDVVLGGGNRITRKACRQWLDRYQAVYCAFDFDAGGLEMFNTLRQSLGSKARFVQPPDWSEWYHACKKTPNSTHRFTRAIALAEDLGFDGLAEAFRVTGKFMEQETILDDRYSGEQ